MDRSLRVSLPSPMDKPISRSRSRRLNFLTTFSNSPGASNQTRAAFVYGAGADVNLTSRVFVRVQYRGFVYSNPDINVVGNLGNDRVTHLFEPSVGLDTDSR